MNTEKEPNKALLLLLAIIIVLSVTLMMEAYERIPADCGTVLEVCDCAPEAPSCWLQEHGFWP